MSSTNTGKHLNVDHFAVRGVCHSLNTCLNTDGYCVRGILPFPLSFLQVSFKGNYEEVEPDLSDTVVGG